MKMNEDRFNFFIPATISKSKDANGNDEMWVQGIASTSEKDLEGETLDPSGYDTSYFLKSGWLKWEHGKDPNQYIGEPTEANITTANELFIRGKLYPESKTAKEVYELAEVLEKSNAKRQLGWSIEGKATKRNANNPKKVEKALITNVVLTTNPIGKNTFAEIIKGSYKEPYIKPEYNKEITCDGEVCLLDIKHDGFHYLLTPEFDIVKKAIDCPDLEKTIKTDIQKAREKDILEVWINKGNKELQKLIEYIGENGNGGHSFEIVVDPDMKENKKVFYWDGDGSDWIGEIHIEMEKFEKKEHKLIKQEEKNKRGVVEKAIEAGSTTGRETDLSSPSYKGKDQASGAVLKKEDEESDTKNQSFNIDCDDPDKLMKDSKCLEKAFTFLVLCKQKGLLSNETMKKIDEKIVLI